MRTLKTMIAALMFVAVAVPARPNVIVSFTDSEDEKAESRAEKEEDLYDAGNDMLDEHEWRKAAATFERVAQMHMAHADGALYWLAYAQSKMGQRSEALATIVDLQKQYPKSRWVEDGKQLEVEIRQAAGQRIDPGKVENVEDDELKLMALNGLMQNDPERAVPILEKILSGNGTLKLKERALFVLSQSNSQQGLDILARTAKSGPPDLRSKAIRYLGIMGGEHSRAVLNDVYATSGDLEVKRSILKSFMISGDKARLLALAKSESNPDLRMEAVTQLGIAGGRSELADLYNSEQSTEVRKKIIQAMFLGGNSDKLGEIARSEKNPELRITAIKNLGLLGGTRAGQILVSIYNSDQNRDVRHTVINSLFIQNNASAMVSLARAEQNSDLKKEIISKLSLMHSKEASDYLMEFLRE
jgi:HEAT repeat protein